MSTPLLNAGRLAVSGQSRLAQRYLSAPVPKTPRPAARHRFRLLSAWCLPILPDSGFEAERAPGLRVLSSNLLDVGLLLGGGWPSPDAVQYHLAVHTGTSHTHACQAAHHSAAAASSGSGCSLAVTG